jgi:hypothetical protein
MSQPINQHCANCAYWIMPPQDGAYPRHQVVEYAKPLEQIEPDPITQRPQWKTVPGTERRECRGHGPMVSAHYDWAQAAWPQTRADDWCAEWKAEP